MRRGEGGMDMSGDSPCAVAAPVATSRTRVVVLRTTRGSMTNYNYVVVDVATRQAVLVDPSWQADVVVGAVVDAGARVAGILLTHSHPDHIDLAASLGERFGCPLWMSKEEIAWSGYHAPGLVAIDETPFHVGSMTIRPMLTPGHTPGCMCYRVDDDLFTGDVLFAEGCGICPDVAAALRMYDSLGRIRREIGETTRIYPGHSFGLAPGQSFATVQRENIYLQFSNRDDFAAFRTRKGQSRAKLFTFH